MNLGLANWKIKYKHTWLFYRHHCLAHFNKCSKPSMFAAATKKWYSDPSTKEITSKVVTPPFVRQALTYEPQCLPHLSTRYEVMKSPSVLDGARHFRPAEQDVKLVHGTWAQVKCHLPLLWTPATFSARCVGISPGLSVTWDWSHDFLLLWTPSTGIHVDL